MTLYNEDGSVWHQFRLSSEYTIKYLMNRMDGFKPFAVPDRAATIVLLRIVAESSNWLEVEVNEDTRATKFISKADPMWGTTTYEYWLAESGIVHLSGTQHLRSSPNGPPVPDYKDHRVDRAYVRKIDGDWAYVEEEEGSTESLDARGWIRWRNGREIIVGCLLNERKVPSSVGRIS